MTESKNPVRLGDIRTAGLGDEYENISEAYMLKVDVIGAFSVNLGLINDDMETARDKAYDLIKYFKELHSEIEFEYDERIGFRWYSSQNKKKFGEICISVIGIGDMNSGQFFLTEHCKLSLFPNVEHNKLNDLPKECLINTPYPKITRYLASQSSQYPLVETTLNHSNICKEAAYEYAKGLMIQNNDFVRMTCFENNGNKIAYEERFSATMDKRIEYN